MAIHFTCPHCQKSIRVPDDAGGRTGRCPGCMASLTVPRSEPASATSDAGTSAWAPPTDYLEEEAAPRAAQGVGWSLARVGLGSLHVGSALFLIAVGFAAIWGAAAGFRHVAQPSGELLAVLGIASLVSMLLVAVGIVLICFTPSAAQVRGFALASLLCTVGFVVASISLNDQLRRNMNRPRGDVNPALLSILISLLFLGSFVFLAFYARGIGAYFQNHRLRASAGRWIRFVLLGILGWIGFWFLAGIVLRNQNQLLTLLGLANLAFLIFAIVVAVWFLRNVRSAAVTIRDARLEPVAETPSSEADNLAWESIPEEPAP